MGSSSLPIEENIERPTRNETDDDLLKQQEIFLSKSKKPSVKFVSFNKNSKPASEENHDDIYGETSTKTTQNDIEVITEDVVSDVQERDICFTKPFEFQFPPVMQSRIYQLLNEKVDLSKFAANKSQSIFAQILSSIEDKNDNSKEKEIETCSRLIDGSGLAPDGKDTEMKKIHEENLAKLAAMSKEEIIYEQEQLKNCLKPEILSFLKKRSGTKKAEAPKYNEFQSTANKVNVNKNLKDNDLPGKILRKEGNEDCDALILEKALKNEGLENNEFSTQNQKDSRESRSNDTKTSFGIPDEATELFEGSNKGLWKNMNKIEKEKLEWMTHLPQPNPVNLKTKYTARFDFEGKLLEREADIPTYKGLHHHGEEPEIPGYSLEELFLLARSSLQSQRITALNTIAHILENNWCGMMDSCFDAPLLPLLLNAGIVPLLRWALDDTSLTSISATITAIHSLLISKADEACSDKTFCWLNGHLVPQLEPQDLDEPNIVMEELTDADLIKLDVVKGFLRIDILPRFMYILKVLCPPPLVCKLIIEICSHLAQHSSESAKQVAEYPGFINLIFEKFLPLNWHFTDSSTLTDTVNYSCPMASAVKLMRIIVSANKELALDVIEKYGLVSRITFYLTVQPLDGKLTPQDVQQLVIETLKMWHSFMCYGLTFEVFLNLFPIFLKQLTFCLSLNLNSDVRKHIQDFVYATHLFKSFEALTVVAAEQEDNKELVTAMNEIFRQALVCLQKWIWQFSQETVSSYGIALLAACMNFIVTHCRKSHKGLICKNWKPCSAAKDTFEKYLVPSMKSNIFQNILKDFRSFSLFLCSEISGNKRDGKTIVSLGSIIYGEDVVPILKEGSPFPLLSAVLNYILLYKNFFHDCGNECIEILFCTPVLNYLKEVSVKELKTSCWFLKFETYFIYQLVQLSSYLVSSETSIYHETAISVLPSFTLREECLVEDLFENIVFNTATIPKLSSLLASSNSNENSSVNSLVSRLPVISQCYISCFMSKNAICKSRNLLFRSSDIDSLFCLSTPSPLVPKDWCFMPIVYLYQKVKLRKEVVSLTPNETLQVTSSLQWIFLCHTLNLPVIRKIPASAQVYYLYLVFLLDEDLFRDEKVKALLLQCMPLILKQNTLKLVKINWNGIKTFDDLYLEMLIQYEAVSYGDETFGSFLVLPLQQCCPSQWKKLLLIEHLPVLSFLRVPLNKLLVPLQNFLQPIETDKRLLSEYFKLLASGSLNHRRCPLLYLMAVHHIHNFLFIKSDSHVKCQKLLLTNILRSKKDLQKKILLYSKLDETSEYGFNMSEELSLENKNHLSDIMGVPVVI